MADRVSKSASADKMEGIHDLLADAMLARMQQAKDGGEPLSAAEWSAIRQFLRDNYIEAARDNAKIHSIAEDAPTFDADEGVA